MKFKLWNFEESLGREKRKGYSELLDGLVYEKFEIKLSIKTPSIKGFIMIVQGE